MNSHIYHVCKDGKQKPGHREDCLSCNPAKRSTALDKIVMQQTVRISELKTMVAERDTKIAELEAQLEAMKAEAQHA